MPAGAGFGDRYLGQDQGQLSGMRDEKGIVFFRDAASYIGSANALLRIIRRKRLNELARDAAAILLREQMPCLRAGDGESPAGWLHQIVFQSRTSGRHTGLQDRRP